MYNRSNNNSRRQNPTTALNSQPRAVAMIKGSEFFPEINGIVRFFDTDDGVFVIAEVNNLPSDPFCCDGSIFGFHVHEGTSCNGNQSDPFARSLSHYNPSGAMHPNHAGDMPPLFGNDGYAFLAFVTNRFSIDEILGRSVIVHSMRDDFKTQPSGDAGEKIACGIISPVAR